MFADLKREMMFDNNNEDMHGDSYNITPERKLEVIRLARENDIS